MILLEFYMLCGHKFWGGGIPLGMGSHSWWHLPFSILRICSDATFPMFTAFSVFSTLLTLTWALPVCICFQVIGTDLRKSLRQVMVAYAQIALLRALLCHYC